jgi:hypothetical protein
MALHYEYMRRFDRGHASSRVAIWSARLVEQLETGNGGAREFDTIGLTPFALAMPEEYKSADPVASYRRLYASKETAWAKAGLITSAAHCALGAKPGVRRPVMTWRDPASRPTWMPTEIPRYIPTSAEITAAKHYVKTCRLFDAARLTPIDVEAIWDLMQKMRSMPFES